MLELLIKSNQLTLLHTNSEKASKFITNEIVNQLGYKYCSRIDQQSQNVVINCSDYLECRNLVKHVQGNVIVVSTIDPGVWKELNPDINIINLDKLEEHYRINLLSFVVLSNQNLREGFSSGFWVNSLKLVSNNFFEIYILHKICQHYQQKVSFNKSFVGSILSYLEDNLDVEPNIDFYPDKDQINSYLYFLMDPYNSSNPYKIFNEMELFDRIYHKYKIIYGLSSKEIENTIIDMDYLRVNQILKALEKIIDKVYFIGSVSQIPDMENYSLEETNPENMLSIYPLCFVFLLMDKRVIGIKVDNRYFLFEIRGSSSYSRQIYSKQTIISILNRSGVKISDLVIFEHDSRQILDMLMEVVFNAIRVNIDLAYNILRTPIMAVSNDYYNNLGFVAMVKGDYEVAKQNLTKSYQIKTNDFLSSYNLACLHWLQNEYDKALKIIQNISTISTKYLGVIIPIYPFPKKNLLFNVDSGLLLKISLANLLFLNGNKQEAFRIIEKIPENKVKYSESFYKYYLECREFIYESCNTESI
ncbi:MAG: hypothetical protein ABDH21_05475 [bacterium]